MCHCHQYHSLSYLCPSTSPIPFFAPFLFIPILPTSHCHQSFQSHTQPDSSPVLSVLGFLKGVGCLNSNPIKLQKESLKDLESVPVMTCFQGKSQGAVTLDSTWVKSHETQTQAFSAPYPAALQFCPPIGSFLIPAWANKQWFASLICWFTDLATHYFWTFILIHSCYHQKHN